MVMGKSDVMAQAVYLASMEAARGNCKCRTCQILRKANKSMVDQFLAGQAGNPGSKGETIKLPDEPGEED